MKFYDTYGHEVDPNDGHDGHDGQLFNAAGTHVDHDGNVIDDGILPEAVATFDTGASDAFLETAQDPDTGAANTEKTAAGEEKPKEDPSIGGTEPMGVDAANSGAITGAENTEQRPGLSDKDTSTAAESPHAELTEDEKNSDTYHGFIGELRKIEDEIHDVFTRAQKSLGQKNEIVTAWEHVTAALTRAKKYLGVN